MVASVDLFILGLAKGALDVGCNTLLLWLHGKKDGPFMNGLHFFFGLGALLAPLILSNILVATGGILWTFRILALVSLPIAAWTLILPEPPCPPAGRRSSERNLSTGTSCFIVIGISPVSRLRDRIRQLGLYVCNNIETQHHPPSRISDVRFLGNVHVWTFARYLGFDSCPCSHDLVRGHFRLSRQFEPDLALGDSALVLWIDAVGLGLFTASIFLTIMMLAGERMQVTWAITGWFLVGSGIGGMPLPWAIGQAFVLVGAQAMPVLVLSAFVVNLLVLSLFAIFVRSRTFIT